MGTILDEIDEELLELNKAKDALREAYPNPSDGGKTIPEIPDESAEIETNDGEPPKDIDSDLDERIKGH